MNYRELSELLNSNIEQKNIFFKKISAPEFLPHFIKYNVLTFDDNCGVSIISYLIRLLKFNSELKNTIIEIVNSNLKIYQNMSGYVFDSLLTLLKEFTIEDIENKIDYLSLFNMDNAWLFDKLLLERDISSTNFLYKELVKSLVNYKIYKDKTWNTTKAVSCHGVGVYTIVNLLNTEPYKNNLERIFQKDDIFNFLIEQYKNIHEQIGDLSFIERQYIKPVEPIENAGLDSYDVRDIIIDCIALSIEHNNSTVKFEQLLNSEISMFKKLALYSIFLNFDKYKNDFVEFFNNFNIEQVPYYIYELMSILESFNIDQSICQLIYDRLMTLDEPLRYRLLHALKNQALFKDEFLILKDKYGEEIAEPKLIFSIKTYTQIPQSTIIEEFASKNLKEQMIYLEKYKPNINHENVIQVYSMLSVFFNTIESAAKCRQNFNYSKLLDLVAYYLEKDINSEVFHHNCTKMLIQLINILNTEADIKSLFMIIETQIKKWKTDCDNKLSLNLQLDNARLYLGQYIKVWLICFIKNKNHFADRISFMRYEFDKNENLSNQLLYYNIGIFYSLLCDVFKFTPIYLKEKILAAFIEGLINSNQEQNLEVWDKFKEYILPYFKSLEENSMTRKNFLYSLIHIKFKLRNENLFEFFYGCLKRKDKEDFLWNILYPTRNPKYNKQDILDYWRSMINSSEIFAHTTLLSMFNEYADMSDLRNYLKDLTLLFDDFKTLPNKNIKTMFELKEFLEKFDGFINNIDTSLQLKVEIFEMLYSLLNVFSKYEYIFVQEAQLLKTIIENYYKNFQDIGNIKVLLEEIYKTPNLIQYSDIFQEMVLD